MIAALKLFFIAISLLAHISPSRAQGGCLSRAVNAADCNGAKQRLPYRRDHSLEQSRQLETIGISGHCFFYQFLTSSTSHVPFIRSQFAGPLQHHAAQAILNGCNGRGGSTAIRSTDGATIQVKLQYYGTA
ncbi:hypothetical protein PSHT_12087 [Puccinia striiformis]|uniref:Uncharacterized protein n=1 Tax=Puccinia striiformis TaxID=27350 RepID=A0A2S4UYX6_9BASI|nr:hypothetical protein PSHT_12087 [Puccinia striiformis]